MAKEQKQRLGEQHQDLLMEMTSLPHQVPHVLPVLSVLLLLLFSSSSSSSFFNFYL